MAVITHGIRRVAFYNPSDGTTVRATAIEANNTEYERREIETEDLDPTGGRYYGGDYSRLRVRFQDLSLFTQLNTWRAADTRISAAAEGSSIGILWTETDHVSMVRPVNVMGSARGRADFVDVELVREGHGAHAIYRAVNLLNHKAAASGTSYDQSIVFPNSGATLTAAVTDTAAGGTLTITAKNYAGTSLGSASQSTASGRVSAELTLPSNTYTAQVTVTLGTSISNVSLRVDGETAYTAY